MKPLAVVLLTGLALAQTDTATVTGLVSDATQAALPGAAIEITNRATGLKYRSTTNEAGVYAVTALPVGGYDLSVQAKGFQTFQRTEITLHAGDRARIDVQMQLGSMSEVVEVSGRAPLLQSETSSLSQVIENASIINMPLNGRNYQQLALLAPGVLPIRTTNFVTDAFSVNGANMLQNQFVMDGADNTNYLHGVVIASNQVVKPSVDAIQEFKMETHNLSAEFGRGGGGVIQVTTRSGTNNFHGTLFEFFRNDKLDANNFFNSGNRKPPYRQNQYGATFGGPIKKDRTFFFASWQGTKIREKLTLLNVIPTPAMIGGEFTTPIYDPATQDAAGNRVQFAGNRIPVSRIDPVAAEVLKLYPAPNRTNVQNYLFNASRNDDDGQVDSRFDHRFREADNMFVRYSYHDRARLEPGNLPDPAAGGNSAVRSATAHSVVFSETHVFPSANKVNEFRMAYSLNQGFIDTPTRIRNWEKFGFKGTYDRPDIMGTPNFTLANYTAVGDRSFAPDPKQVDIWQFVDNVSWTKGRHSIRFGGNIRRFQRYAGTTDYARGVYTFNGQFTAQAAGRGSGSSVADALLGLTSNATLSNPLDHTLRSLAWEGYIQDNFKVNRKLTLNLGFRYEYQPPFVEANDHLATFVTQQGIPGYGTIVIAEKGGSNLERSLQKNDPNNFAPRVGLAYQLTEKTVLRAGYSIFYDSAAVLPFDQMPVVNPPYYLRTDIPTANSASTSLMVVRNGFAADALKPGVLSGRSLFSASPYDLPDALTHQWNFNLQRSVRGNAVVSAAYVGSNTIHRRSSADINQPIPGAGALPARRAFPDLAGITTSIPMGTNNYQGLELKLERQFHNGFSSLNGYTWSRTLTTEVGLNSRNAVRDKGLSPQDIRHRFFSTAVYELPFGAGKKWLTSGPAALIAGGWQISSLIVMQTGLVFSPGIAVNSANSTGGNRPDRLRDGNLPRGERSPDRWFDKTAFAIPAAYTFGNSGFNILEGPGVFNIDGTIVRVFRLNERFRLDFRTEFFNVANDAHFALPNATIDNAAAGRISSTSTSARQIQFGLKLLF
jgi:hypothetical protein